MNATRSLERLRWAPLALALLLPLGGCEDDTTPVITKLDAFPVCDVMTEHAAPQAGVYLDVNFFARASSGNRFDDPTGANSPLEWRWNFGDGGTASNVVNPTHRYREAGTYEVSLTVEDKDGQTANRSITVFVGEEYTDLDIVLVDAALLSTAPSFRTQGSNDLRTFDGWNATFEGSISTNCEITGLFQQYFWEWDMGYDVVVGGETVDVLVQHLDLVTHRYPPRAGTFVATLTVTEQSTGVARSMDVSVSNPSGVLVPRSSDLLVPGGSAMLTVTGHLLHGMTEMQLELSYDDAFLDITSATDVGALGAYGFSGSVDTSTEGTIVVRFTGGTVPADDPGVSWDLVNLSFDTLLSDDVDPTAPNWALEPHQRVIVAVGIESLRVLAGSEELVSGGLDGGLRVESDCNGNGVPDSVDLASNPVAFDQNQNGILDACES